MHSGYCPCSSSLHNLAGNLTPYTPPMMKAEMHIKPSVKSLPNCITQGWWWERAGILSDGGSEDERFGWGVCAAAILRNLAANRANLGSLADPECISVLVRTSFAFYQGWALITRCHFFSKSADYAVSKLSMLPSCKSLTSQGSRQFRRAVTFH